MLEIAQTAHSSVSRPENRSLARIPLFSALPQDEVRALDVRCLWRRVPNGEWVIDYQSDGEDVYFVLSGLARVVIVSAGREMILRDIKDGEYFGHYSAIDGKPRSAAIVAASDTLVARMPAAVFREAMQTHAAVRDNIMKALVADIRTANRRAHEQANFDVRKRLCAELLRLSRVMPDGRVIVSPPPTHAEIASRISTHREAITKTLSALERAGVITRSSTSIVLADPNHLRRELVNDV